jgi:hypothetical protein
MAALAHNRVTAHPRRHPNGDSRWRVVGIFGALVRIARHWRDRRRRPVMARAMKAAREGAARYRNALRRLAG